MARRDSSAESTKKAPSFYEVAADMSGRGQAGASGSGSSSGSGSKSTAPNPSDPAEKARSIAALLEVFKKMSDLEEDPEAKALIRQMSDTALQYKTRIEGGPSAAQAGAAGAAGAAPAAGAVPPPTPGAAGAGAGAGAGAAGAGMEGAAGATQMAPPTGAGVTA